MRLTFSIPFQLTRQRQIMQDVREIVGESPRTMPTTIKTKLVRIFRNAFKTSRTWGCGRADDIQLSQYNMPEASSSRPSEARPSMGPPTRSLSMREPVRILKYMKYIQSRIYL